MFKPPTLFKPRPLTDQNAAIVKEYIKIISSRLRISIITFFPSWDYHILCWMSEYGNCNPWYSRCMDPMMNVRINTETVTPGILGVWILWWISEYGNCNPWYSRCMDSMINVRINTKTVNPGILGVWILWWMSE